MRQDSREEGRRKVKGERGERESGGGNTEIISLIYFLDLTH